MSRYFPHKATVKRKLKGRQGFDKNGQPNLTPIGQIDCLVQFSIRMNSDSISTKQETVTIKQLSINILSEFEFKPNDVVVYKGEDYILADVIPEESRYKTYWRGYS
jgi:hypothetical protein